MSDYITRRRERVHHDIDVLTYVFRAIVAINSDKLYMDLTNHVARRIREAKEELALIDDTDEVSNL